MKLGVAFVSWGRAKLLEKTLESFDLHTPPEPPAVIVDNGSKEDVQNVINVHRDLFDVYMQWEENRGKPAALNYAAKVLVDEHDCTHILFCDSDIEFKPGWYRGMLEAFKNAEAYGKVGMLSGYAHGPTPKHNPIEKLGIYQVYHPPGCCVMMSVETFNLIGRFDECRKICKVDTSMSKLLNQAGYVNFSIYPESLIDHTGQAERTFDVRTGKSIYRD